MLCLLCACVCLLGVGTAVLLALWSERQAAGGEGIDEIVRREISREIVEIGGLESRNTSTPIPGL